MTILAIDSSGMTATVALMQDDRVLAEYTVNNKMTHSQTLLPMIDEICRMVQLDKKTIEAVAIAAGPGSFTGLRIGSATAKGIALAMQIPIIEVPTLEGMAYNFACSDAIIAPMMDAKRDQVYTCLYRFENKKAQPLIQELAVSVEDIIALINEKGERVILLGDGSDAYHAILEERLRVDYQFAPAHLKLQRAGSVAVSAMQRLADGKTVSGVEHKPEYLRVSQAEREREARLKEAQNG